MAHVQADAPPSPRTGQGISWVAFRDLWERQRRESARPVRSIAVLVATVLWAIAILLVFLAWNGAAERIDVWQQVPYLVSGGLSALILTLMGAAVLLFGALAEPARHGPAAEPGDGEPALLTRTRG